MSVVLWWGFVIGVSWFSYFMFVKMLLELGGVVRSVSDSMRLGWWMVMSCVMVLVKE